MNSVSFKLARSELSRGFKGFWIYLGCLALGTAAIAAAGSVTETFSRGVAGEARALLGADAQFTTAQRRPTVQERAFAESLGAISETVSLDVMGAANDVRAQVDVRAVDGSYPLIGKTVLSGSEAGLQAALARRGDHWGVVVTQSFLDTFGVAVGDAVEIGPVAGVVTARLDVSPDRIGTPGTFGPEATVALEAMAEAGRLSPGQLFRSSVRILFKPGQTFAAAEKTFNASFPDEGTRLRGPEDAVDGLQNLLQTLNSFLAVIGIAALVAGGVGVAQATAAFLDSRRQSIAVLKVFGADAATIRSAYLLQLGVLALVGTLAGTALGAAAPYLLALFAGGAIPIPQALGLYPVALLKALALGVLAAAVFALPAIGQARATRPASLFRRIGDAQRNTAPWLERGWAIGAAAALAGLAVATSYRPALTAMILVGAVVTAGVFVVAALIVTRLAKAASTGARGFWRLALANLGGPGSLAPTIVPALGLGLALLVLVVSVQTNLIRQITDTAPANAPSLVFSQIPNAKVDSFNAVLAANGVDTDNPDAYRQAPFLLARVTALKGKPLVESDVAESERWVVRGETSLTYFAQAPPETVLVAGSWWDPDYAGPLLVSVEEDAAKGLGVTVGDTIGFRIAGREVTAAVASLRKVDWGTFGIGSNTAFILSPGTLEAANPAYVAIARATPEQESAIIAALGAGLREVVVFQTRPALETAARVFGQIALAVNAAAGIVTLAGLLVLFGTFASLAQKRRREAALLKVFGASRGEILRLYATEFAVAAGIAALVGTLIGISASWPIVTFVFEATWSLPWQPAAWVMGAAVSVSAAGGAMVGLSTLSRTPADVLRTA
ncbi:ABC transporter permease [Hyphomonas sp.]|jgi:putative ABC transport system permease protein|uniref:ABC transporter permease n=1 Tax=Hyphomonas sp. TaxID=87 RepID=UPI0037BE2B71